MKAVCYNTACTSTIKCTVHVCNRSDNKIVVNENFSYFSYFRIIGFLIDSVHLPAVCRSRICIQPSTSDGTVFQLLLLSSLDYCRDRYVSGKGEGVTHCLEHHTSDVTFKMMTF